MEVELCDWTGPKVQASAVLSANKLPNDKTTQFSYINKNICILYDVYKK